MKIIKYGHACFVLNKNGQKLLVDPGDLTPEHGGNQDIMAVVITHEHFDHFNANTLQGIIAANPGVKVFSTPEVASKVPGAQAVKAGTKVNLGEFELEFFGGMHQQVHPDFPTCQNIGLLVDNKVYYAGDSFTLPQKPVELLMVPTSGPWQKMGEVMDFIGSAKPKWVVPTHNGLNTDNGNKVVSSWLNQLAAKQSFEVKELSPGESMELS